MEKKVDIKFQTSANTKPLNTLLTKFKGLGDSLRGIAKGIGGAFSPLNEIIGEFFRGGIWGVAAETVTRIFSAVFNSMKKKSEEAAKAAKEAHSERMKCLDEYAAAIDKLSQKRTATINQNLKALNEELDATKELTKATLELEKAEARKRGDTGRMAEIDREMEVVDVESARVKLENEIAAAQKRQQSGEQDLSKAIIGWDSANNEVQSMEAALANRMGAIIEKARNSAKGQAIVMPSSAGAYITYGAATESDRTSAANQAVEAFKKTDEYKDLAAQLEEAQKKAMTFGEKMLNAKNAIQESADAEQNLLDRMSALNLKEEAKIKNKEAQSVEEKKKAEEKRIADVKAAELKAAAEAAKERERLDREAHKKRMDDIRAEIAAATGKGNILKATAANAQNEFDRAFAMYRDPTHAASVINEEKDYRNDLNRLHRDASRYGGKWRIDELSRLMAAGDSQGVSDTLATWRKSKSFSPEIEAMVRASAAERTKTTAEEELRKIQNNTANLDKKLDELLSMKGD
jgi:hypothetical protein